LISSVVSLVIMVYPIIDVADPGMYAAKICAVVVVSNVLGMAIYKAGQRRSHRQEASGVKPTTEALRHGEERERV
jgi:hypothetical protein